MDERKKTLLYRMVEDYNDAYETYITSQGLVDHPVVRVGFFVALEQIVDRDPIPDEELQREVLSYLRKVKHSTWDDYLEETEALLVEVSTRKTLPPGMTLTTITNDKG
jgi:hypothetical protein